MLERVLACDVVIAVYKIGTLFPFLLSSMHMIIIFHHQDGLWSKQLMRGE